MGATRKELLDLADFWEKRGDLAEANRLRVSAGEVQMYAIYAVSTTGWSYGGDMVGEPSDDRDKLLTAATALQEHADAQHNYGTAYWVYPVKQETVWVRVR